ncbi:MAG: hypothetical protein J6C85_02115 [Alphaproteobacteria bacterium]|nr:hypothetical protein [Alphaproteobacteria bacterium]
MSKKSDYLFLSIKQVYPAFAKPAALDMEIWEEMLEPFDQDDIKSALKDYRRTDVTGQAPRPGTFRTYLKPYEKVFREVDELPWSPESYLMEEDIKAGRCKYFFPDYASGVQYILDVRVKEIVGEKMYRKFTPGMKYRAAVDYGLFADFDEVLEIVTKSKGRF